MSIAEMQRISDLIADQGTNIGYNQARRWDLLDIPNRRIVPNSSCDCSSSCGTIAFLGGYSVDIQTAPFFTGNFAERLRAANFAIIRFANLAQVKTGDFLVTPSHHVVFARDEENWLSAEVDERGRSSGGKPGDQTGREVRYRPPYLRPGGWTYICRPPSDSPTIVAPPISGRVPLDLVAEDAELGPLTISRTQRFLGVPQTGVWDGSVQHAMQRLCGLTSGPWGPISRKAMQRLVGAKPDGIWGPRTTLALQRWLNKKAREA